MALIFFAWLVVELAALILLVRLVGWLGVLLLLVLSTLSGYLLLRGEGIVLARRLAGFIDHAQRTGEIPPLPLAQSLPRFVAGALLIVPGFVTDLVAVLVLLPPLRGYVIKRFDRLIAARHHKILRDKVIIDIEAEVLPDDGGAPPPPEPPPGPPDWLRLPPPGPHN